MTTEPIKEKQRDVYKSSRIMFILEAAFEYFINILTGGAFLAKLTTTIGISDSMTAILSSAASLAAAFQLFAIFLSHRTPVKRWVFPINFCAQAMVSTLYVLPFFPLGSALPWIFFFLMLFSRAGVNMVAPAKSNWMFNLVDSKKRGEYVSRMNIASLAGGMIFTLAASTVIDKFEAAGNINGSFIVITVSICILTVIQLSCLLLAKEKPIEIEKKESPFKCVGSLFKNKIYRRILTVNLLWSFANSITSPFLGTFQIKELGFSMTFISVVGVVLNLLQIGMAFFFGKLSTRRSYSSIWRLSYIFAALGFVCVALSTRQNGYVLFTGYRVMTVFYSAAISVSSSVLLFNSVPQAQRTAALAMSPVVTGLFSFFLTLIISPVFDFMQTLDLSLFGTQIYVQQIFAVASFIVTLILIIYHSIACHKLLKDN
ncbi:MAG: MFS transporter [Clostridia bacterium]|nr:MFS transporter [Clostridia bacterium]